MAVGERLDKLLSRLGYCTRTEVRSALHVVTVDGEQPRRSDVKVTPEQVTFEGEKLDPDPLWILLHKPTGLTCSHRDPGELVYDLFPDRYLRRRPTLETVGRLDKETSGVLLLTTDGQALHRFTSPKSEIPKVYEVGLAEPPDELSLLRLRSGGLMLEGESKPLLPCEIEITGEYEVRMTLHEGRYRQIRRSWELLDNAVRTLHRSHFGSMTVDGLAPGEFRLLSTEPAL